MNFIFSQTRFGVVLKKLHLRLSIFIIIVLHYGAEILQTLLFAVVVYGSGFVEIFISINLLMTFDQMLLKGCHSLTIFLFCFLLN